MKAQSIYSGVQNIIRAELLFLSRIVPQTNWDGALKCNFANTELGVFFPEKLRNQVQENVCS